MTMKPFEIQSTSLSIGGVTIDTSAQGKLVIPGVTRAGSYVAIEVEDTNDQTQTWTGTPVVIDGYTYAVFMSNEANGIVGWSQATYAIEELDDDGFIDGINVVDGGANYTGEAVTFSQVMYAAPEGTPIDNSNNSAWVQIPFRVRCGAGEIESEFGGSGNANTGNFTFDGNRMSAIETGEDAVIENDLGVVSLSQEYAQLQWSDDGELNTNNSEATASYVWTESNGTFVQTWAGQDAQNGPHNYTWQFQHDGGLKFPDNTVMYSAGVAGSANPMPYGGFSTLPDFLDFVMNTNVKTGQNGSGVFFAGDANGGENGLTDISYPIRTNFDIPGNTKTTITVDMVVNDECADFSVAVFESETQPRFNWGTQETRIAGQYNCVTPHIDGNSTEVFDDQWGLQAGNTYRVRFTYDPNNIPNVMLETMDTSNNVFSTITVDEQTLNTNNYYRIGFTADQDSGPELRTYMKNLTIQVDGGQTYTDSLMLSGASLGATNMMIAADFGGTVISSTDRGVTWSEPFDTGLPTIGRLAIGMNKIIYTCADAEWMLGEPVNSGLYSTTIWNQQPTLISGTDVDPNTNYSLYWHEIEYKSSAPHPWVAVGRADDGSRNRPCYAYSSNGADWTIKYVTDADLDVITNNASAWFNDFDYNGVGYFFVGNIDGNTAGLAFYSTDIAQSLSSFQYVNTLTGLGFIEFMPSVNGGPPTWSGFDYAGNTWFNAVGNVDPTQVDWSQVNSDMGTFWQDNVGYVPGWSEVTSGVFEGTQFIIAATDEGQVMFWPVAPASPWMSIPSPYTNTVADLIRPMNPGEPTIVVFGEGTPNMTDGEKVVISGVTSATENSSTTEQSYNGTYFIKQNGNNYELYLDRTLTQPWDTSTYWPINNTTGVLTWSHGQFFDSIGYVSGAFFVGNDDGEIYRTDNVGQSWTQVYNQDNGSYLNDIDYGVLGSEVATTYTDRLLSGTKRLTLNDDGSIAFPTQGLTAYQSGYTLNGPTLQLGNDPTVSETIITGPAPDSMHYDARRLIIQGQKGFGGENNSKGEGGDVYIWAGTGGDAGAMNPQGDGGDVKLRGGQGATGGYIRIEAGEGTASNQSGGFVDINAGSNSNTDGNGGDVNIRAGAAGTNGTPGSINVWTNNHLWEFNSSGNLELPGDVINSNGKKASFLDSSVDLNDNADLNVTTNIIFQGGATGSIVDLDSNGNFNNWFNSVSLDPSGNMYAGGENDNADDVIYKFDQNGEVVWKVSIDQFNSYFVKPTLVKWNNSYVYVVGRYYDYNNSTNQICVFSLNESDGTVHNVWSITTSNDSNPEPNDLIIDSNGNPIVVGNMEGVYSFNNNVTAQAGSGVDLLIVNNSDLSRIPESYNTWPWSVDTTGTGFWNRPDNINTFFNLPVTTITGNGGPKHYAQGTDYTAGGFKIFFGESGPATIRIDASKWTNTAALEYLKTKVGFPFTIATQNGTSSFQQSDYWIQPDQATTPDIWESAGTLSPISGGIVSGEDITTIDFQSVMYVNVRYNANGSNGDTGSYGYTWVNTGGDGYQNGDQVKVPGSLLGGVDGVSYTCYSGASQGGIDPNTSIIHFDKTTYPSLDSQVLPGFIANGEGINNAIVISVASVTYPDGTVWDVIVDQSGAGLNNFTFSSPGNDLILTYNWGGVGVVSGVLSDTVKNQTRFLMNQGVDYANATWNIKSSLDAQGFIWTPNWQYNYGGGNWESFCSVAYDSTNNFVYVLGDFNGPAGDICLFKMSSEDGSLIWNKYIENGNQVGGNPGSVSVDSDGNIVVIAEDDNGNTCVTRLDIDGNVIWQVRQTNDTAWNNEPYGGVDSDGNIIVMGSWYNNNDPANTHYVLSFTKLNKTDGSVMWSNYLDNGQKYDMYEQYDNSTRSFDLSGNSFAYVSYVYDVNDSRYVAVASRFPTDGTGIGTYGRWIYNVDGNATYETNTNDCDITPGTWQRNDGVFGTTGDTFTVSPYTSTQVAVHVQTVGAGGSIENATSITFADGSELKSANLVRHSTTQGSNDITLDATMNGKFLHYNGSNGNSWIYVPGNNNVALPIGFVVTIVMDDFSNNRIYIDNSVDYIANINAIGFSPNTTNYWIIGDNGKTGVYTLMKVDTDRWILSGPDILSN